jgi:predicted nucleic acid-binding protein
LSIVVDASAAVEYLLQTELGMRVAQFIDDTDVLAPELLDVEVLAVLRRQALSGHLDPERAQEAIADLRDWPLERLRHRDLLDGAWQLRGHVSAYDAVYVQAARHREASLVTADGPLARAPGLGIVVHNVRSG